MADKRDKHTGLARPQAEGVDALFGGSEFQEPAASEPTASYEEPPIETDDKKSRKMKTSIYLSREALDLLADIKYILSKRERRTVSQGELLDQAVKDLAEKLKINRQD